MYIYSIENLINNKKYIGQTINKPENRKREHFSLLKRNKHKNSRLQNAWNKYGENSFRFKILNEVNTLEELNKLEENLITLNINGYNLKGGGDNHHHSEETKLKISQTRKNRNIPSPTKGMKFTRSQQLKDFYALKSKPNGYPILVSPNGKEFKFINLRDFCRKHKLSQYGLREVVGGKWNHYKGWHLKGVKVNPTNENISKSRRLEEFPYLISPMGDIYEIETTLRKFCLKHKLSVGCLSMVINGMSDSHKGWQILTEN